MLPLLNAQTDPDAAPVPLGKVELDLEGAPFLEPDAPPEPAPGASPPPAKAEKGGKAEPAPKKSKKKLIIILGAAALVLLLGALGAVYFLFFKEEAPKDPEVEVVVIPSTPPELPRAPMPMYNTAWDPFWIEVQDPEGEVRFVYCKFVLVTDNQLVALQVNNKNATLRDAVYYYLRHKSYTFLADLKQLDVIKSEVLNIINYYIVPERTYTRGQPAAEAQPSAEAQPVAEAQPTGEVLQTWRAPQPVPETPPRMEKVSEVLIEDYLIK